MSVTLSQPRRTARITFDDGRVFSAPVGTPLEAYVCAFEPDAEVPAATAVVLDGKLMELSRSALHDGNAVLVGLETADGARIYRRTLTFLLIAVAGQLFPDADVVVEHSITSGGYYCRVTGRPDFTAEELAQLEAEMRAVAARNLPIVRSELPISEALALFRSAGDEEKVALLEQRRKPYFIIYSLLETRDYFHGFMLPSTGYLRYFALERSDEGFLLRYPRRAHPTEIAPVSSQTALFDVFTEYSEWLHALGIRNVSGLNTAIEEGNLTEVILVTESLHEQRISGIAAQIARERDRVRLILIAGPSSSGKTTFARRLAVRLLALGLHPLAVSIDDYFLDREHTPRDEHGDYDFESLYAVDLPLLNRQINALIAGETVTMPRFDFRAGRRLAGPTVSITGDHVLILEGIHALNPELMGEVDPERCFRVYVSALTQLNLDRYNRISTTDSRLLRRIVRDARTRGHSAANTISRWESVRRGERQWVFPYQDNAQAMFNSALTYEMAVLKPMIEPLLCYRSSRARLSASRPTVCGRCCNGSGPPLPTTSPLTPSCREFLGGCVLDNYRPWPLR